MKVNFSEFSPCNLKDVKSISIDLKVPKNKAHEKIRGSLSDVTKTKLEEFLSKKLGETKFRMLLAEALNCAIREKILQRQEIEAAFTKAISPSRHISLVAHFTKYAVAVGENKGFHQCNVADDLPATLPFAEFLRLVQIIKEVGYGFDPSRCQHERIDLDDALLDAFESQGIQTTKNPPVGVWKKEGDFEQEGDFELKMGGGDIYVEVEKSGQDRPLYDFLKCHNHFSKAGNGNGLAVITLPENTQSSGNIFQVALRRYKQCIESGFGTEQIFKRILLLGYEVQFGNDITVGSNPYKSGSKVTNKFWTDRNGETA